MSVALNAHADSSVLSAGTQPDLSLGSVSSTFSAPAELPRAKFTSSGTTATSTVPIATPSHTAETLFSRRKAVETTPAARRLASEEREADRDETTGGDLLDTPGQERRWEDVPETPIATLPKRKSAGGGPKGANLTLRDQEKHIDNLKKENFNIKLRVHFLEERLAQLAPDQIDAALKQNINLKIEVQQRGMEIKKLKRLALELEQELNRLQRGGGGSSNRERELEEKLEERARELRELRKRMAAGQGQDDEALRELEARNLLLEEELDNARNLIEENMEEIERLREIIETRGDHSLTDGDADSRKAGLKRRVEELENENEDLRARLDDQAELLTQREDDKEELVDEVEALRLRIEDLQRRREAESLERSQSRAQVIEEREEREAVEEDLNALRDKLAAATIELQQKEDDIDEKNREIEDLVAEHHRIVEVVEQEWRGEVEEARGQVEELRDVLAERDAESKDLRLNISELEANTNDLHAKFEAALAHLERDAEEKDAELESANKAIEKLSEQVYVLEDENDKLKEEGERLRDEEAAERDRLEALSAALKEKVSSLKMQLEDVTEMCESYSEEIEGHRARQEELARHVENLVDEVQRERGAREQAMKQLDVAHDAHDVELRRERRIIEAKESALQFALNDLSRTQSLLSQRELDLSAVQTALQTLEAESRKLGETHTTARFSLQLEVDRLKRDVERLQDELSRARKDIEERETAHRERDAAFDKLHAENRDLASQLASQTQARLNVAEKLDGVQASLRTAESELVTFRSRIVDLEQRLSKDQRTLLTAETQYRDQLTERNTLLLTIYQYMDKILGVDKTPKGGNAETKPFTNFSVFHDNLITRLKALSQIQLDFDKRCKDTEAKFADKLNEMKRQLENRWKQLDKFEASVKVYAETKAAWRRKISSKEGELEAIKLTNSELAAQLVSIKKPGQTDAMEFRSLTSRAANAERRLANAQNQLVSCEEKIAAMNQKTAAADSKWEARVKEYEARLKAAEERVKRERQGSKERIAELENNHRSLQRQLEVAQKRNQQLHGVLEVNKALPSSPTR